MAAVIGMPKQLQTAIVESGLSESKIKVSDVISGKIDNYQKDIDISQNIQLIG